MDAMLPPGRFFHVGYMVPELEKSMEEFGRIFDIDWTAIDTRSATMSHEELGVVEWNFRVAYSVAGPPHIELIQSMTDSVWPSDAPVLHHLGMWARDLAQDSAHFEHIGLPRSAHGLNEAGEIHRFAFHRNAFGPMIELIAPSSRDAFEQWLNA